MRYVLTCVCLLLSTFVLRAETPDEAMARAKKVLAQVNGKITLKGLKDPVEVLRDRWGIAHIYAKNTPDLFFVQGFVAAQDRLFQIDMWRRRGVGELAEVLGKEAIEADRFARLLRYRGDMDAEWASYSPDTREIATAFTSGINACIDNFGDNLPIEFQILKIKPKRWQPEDILGRMSGIIMCSQFRSEIYRAKLINAVGVDKAQVLAPTDPSVRYEPVKGLDLGGIDDRILAGYKLATKSLRIQPPKTASNNWVVDGTLSESGKPMLASDPHRSIALPSLRYLVHLHAPGWNVIGSGEPALPGVAIGHNERIAWGFTIVGTDQSDFYVEKTHPKNPGLYLVDGQWQEMKVYREKIRVLGQDDVELELRYTRHGPVLFQDDKLHRAYALRWIGAEPGGAAYLGSLAVDRATNKEEFVKALEAWKIPNENMVYADVNGNIGWVAAALTPIRKGWRGLLPVPGDESKYEWQGFLPVGELPQEFNPKRHWIATANHNILPKDYPHVINYEWSAPYRFLRVKSGLAGKKKLTLRDFRNLQHDITSIPGQILTGLLREVKIDDASLQPYVELMLSWDGKLTRESRAGPLYAVWLDRIQTLLYERSVPKANIADLEWMNDAQVPLDAIKSADKAWFGDSPAGARDKLVRDSFADAVTRTKKLLGPDPATWSWGKLHTVTFHHPLETYAPEYAKAFDLGPIARPGDALTPLNTRHDENFKQLHGATYRHVFDLADWDRGFATSAPGQSGQPGSPHYADLLPYWGEYRYFPLYYTRKLVEKTTQNRLALSPN